MEWSLTLKVLKFKVLLIYTPLFPTLDVLQERFTKLTTLQVRLTYMERRLQLPSKYYSLAPQER